MQFTGLQGVRKKLLEGTSFKQQWEDGDRNNRIIPGMAKADMRMSIIQSGFGTWHTAIFINRMDISPGKKTTTKATVACTAIS